MAKDYTDLIIAVKENKPLIHHITNYVTVNDCANMVLSMGASPVMADDELEVEEMVSFAAALVINIGTLSSRTIVSMIKAGQKAKKLGIPIILDPVGVGATKLRTATARQIIEEVEPTVIRGNLAEVKILAGLGAAIRGVDSVEKAEGQEAVAQNLAKKLSCVVAITGAVDVVAYQERLCSIHNGHPMLAEVTGTGCMTTSLVGVYCGITTDYYSATIAGIVTMGLAGEIAHRALVSGQGSGTFRRNLFDAVYNMSPQQLAKGGNVVHHVTN